jgi:hypothetical protein
LPRHLPLPKRAANITRGNYLTGGFAAIFGSADVAAFEPRMWCGCIAATS